MKKQEKIIRLALILFGFILVFFSGVFDETTIEYNHFLSNIGLVISSLSSFKFFKAIICLEDY